MQASMNVYDMPTPQFNIRLDLDLKEAFFNKAREQGTTATNLIIGWIKEYLGIQPANIPSTALEERIAALEERSGK